MRRKVQKSKSKQSLSKKANNGKQIKVKSAWELLICNFLLIFDIHTGSRMKEQRKTPQGYYGVWMKTNKLFWGPPCSIVKKVMLKRGRYGRPAVKNRRSRSLLEEKFKTWAGKVSSLCLCSIIATKSSSVLLLPWICVLYCNGVQLIFLIWFSSKIETVKYVDVYYYKLLHCSITALSLDSHLPSFIPTIPNAQLKKDSWS